MPALQRWTNPMQPPVQSRLPSLEDLTCGNTVGLKPQAITRAQLDAARSLQQVFRSNQIEPLPFVFGSMLPWSIQTLEAALSAQLHCHLVRA